MRKLRSSPNGKTVATLAPIRARLNVVVFDLKSGTMTPITGVSDRDVNGFIWANNDRILFFMDKDGNEASGIYAVNKDGSKPRTLVEPVENELMIKKRKVMVIPQGRKRVRFPAPAGVFPG